MGIPHLWKPPCDPYDFHVGRSRITNPLPRCQVRADAGAPRPGALPALGRDHGAHDHKGEEARERHGKMKDI